MNKLKRVLSIVLVMAMMFSGMVFPAGAANVPCTLTLTNAEATVTANAGETVSVNVDISGLQDNEGWAALTLYAYYDSNVLEFEDWDTGSVFNTSRMNIMNAGGSVSGSINAAKDIQDANKNGNTDEMCVGIAYAATDKKNNPARMTGNGTLWTLKFNVAKDLESQVLPLQFVCLKATVNEDTSAEPATVDGQITVHGVTPTVDEVALDNPSVTVNGIDNVTVKAAATSKKGTDLTSSVEWSVSSNDGVSISRDGTITVAKNAAAGIYTITAQGNSDTAVGSASAELTVVREPAAAKEITISGGADALDIPVTGTADTAFTAIVTDQYGDAMASEIQWSMATDDIGGITFENGKVTVSSSAKRWIKDTAGHTFTITAADAVSGKSAEAKLTVKRAEPIAKSLDIAYPSEITVPSDGQKAVHSTPSVGVTDQYNEYTDFGSNVEDRQKVKNWTIEPKVEGVTIADDGTVAVSNSAKTAVQDTEGIEFTVSGEYNGMKAERTFIIKRAASVPTSLGIYKNGTEVTGDTDTVIVPTSDTANEYTYTAEVYDQYGTHMPKDDGRGALVNITPAEGVPGVTVEINKLIVSKGAQKDAQFTVNGILGSLTKSVTVTVKDIDITWPTVTAKSGTYGQKWSEIVKFSGGSAVLNGKSVAGTFTLVHADSVPDVGDKYQFEFKSEDGQYTVTSAEADAAIAKKALTITADSASRDYNGTALTADSFKTSGLVNGDKISVTVTGTITNAGSVDNVPSGAVITNGSASKNDNYEITYVNGKLTVNARSIKDAVVTGVEKSYEYTGSAIEPEMTLTVDGKTLNKSTDYFYLISDNFNVGTATIEISGKGNYTGSLKVTFEITKKKPVLGTDYRVVINNTEYEYDGMAVGPMIWTGAGVGKITVLYNGKMEEPKNAGTYKVTAVVAEGTNFAAVNEPVDCGTIIINPKMITIPEKQPNLSVKDKEYNGKTDDAVLVGEITFNGVVEGETLTRDKDYTLEAWYRSADAGDAPVAIGVKMLNPNYTLNNTSFGLLGKILPAQTTLSLHAADAVYTGAAYDAANITKTSNVDDTPVYTYYADNNGVKGDKLNEAPKNVGTYWAEGYIAASGNNSEVTSAAVKFQITKAPLTVTAVDNTITYGDAPAADGYTVSGLLGTDDDSVVSGVVYAFSYKQYGNIGTYEITPKDAKADNYDLKFVSGKLTVQPKAVTVSGITAKDRQYNGETAVELDCTKAVFDGVVNNDALTVAAVGTMETADAAEGKEVAISKLVLGGASAGNYVLAETGHQTTTTVNISKKTATELTLTAKDAAYTGAAYDAANVVPSRDAKDVVLTYYADNSGKQGDVLNGAPAAVGTYWVSGKIEETNNIAAAVAPAVKFQITKAPLTITAKDKSITYGEAPANDGAEYAGLVNGETADVVSGLTYAYSYEQYGNVGTYTITPKDAKADNYDIKFVSGKLTVSPKTIGLEWTGAGKLYYDGKAKNVTAAATGLVNDDEIAVTVSGGTQTAVGTYTASATGLTGAKAGNYTLPENRTAAYTIEAALTSVTVSPATITATIDGLTIKLVGYKNANEEITVNGTTADKLTVNGVEYTIDKSGVKEMPAQVEVLGEESKVTKPEGAEIADTVVDEINKPETKGEGLNEAAADKIAAADKTITEQDKTDEVTKVQVKITLNIQPKSFTDGKLTLNIEPKITYTYVKADGITVVRKVEDQLANSDIKAPVTISVKLPNGFNPNFAKHNSEMIPVTVDNGVATWQQSSFSDVTLVSDTRKAEITFQFEDGHTQTISYTAADIGKTFPTDSKSGYTFNGWSDGTNTYTSLTDAALTALNGTKTLTANFSAKGHTGGSGGGGGGSTVSTYVITAKAGSGGTISPNGSVSVTSGKDQTFTIKANDGYKIEDVLVDGKSVGAVAAYTFTKVTAKHTIEARFAKTEDVTPSTGFTDVKTTDYFFNAVEWAAKNNITNGLTSATFGPDVTCTRAQTVTFLWRAAGSPAPKTANNPFTDVKASDYYYNAVLWAVENGITNGASATTFAPNATVERGQVVAFLWRAAGKPAAQADNHFTDLKDGAYYTDAVLWAVEKGITTGTSATTFAPEAGCTRGQIVTFLYRAAQ